MIFQPREARKQMRLSCDFTLHGRMRDSEILMASKGARESCALIKLDCPHHLMLVVQRDGLEIFPQLCAREYSTFHFRNW